MLLIRLQSPLAGLAPYGWLPLVSGSSQIDEFLLVVDFVVKLVEIANARRSTEGVIWLQPRRICLFQLSVEFVPLAVEILAIFLILRNCVVFSLRRGHLQCLFKCIRINLFQNCLQRNQRFL